MPVRRATSIVIRSYRVGEADKIVVFFTLEHPALVFVYSAWIINDQCGMAFLSQDADRLRRTFDDYWFIRIMYPLGLFIPWFYPGMQYGRLYGIFGVVLFTAWVFGVISVYKRVGFGIRPTYKTLLRNMVYWDD